MIFRHLIWAALLVPAAAACSTSPSGEPSLCGQVCFAAVPCQPSASLSACANYCEANARRDRALGCGAQLEADQHCMIDNMACKDGDVDYMHLFDMCLTQSLALQECRAPADAG